ncbi:cysteine-rich CWC family protein [Shewanella fidelis]|uniref:cysteine-rich CWC family protein n=1 Tax=Shewanella fidelis TaxID=173509 RepID=UPI000566D850|nr:cysteine-rich CWC family protein [Shewanella fidelis]
MRLTSHSFTVINEFESLKQQPENCPLCQRLNGCAVTSGGDIKACWCNREPHLTKAGLTAVLSEDILATLDGKVCICEACLDSIKAELALKHALYRQVD